MKSQLLYLAGGLALSAGLIFLGLLTQHFDAKPNNWGPQGVDFEVWAGAWRARRDLYTWVSACAFFLGTVLGLAGLWVSYGRRLTRG